MEESYASVILANFNVAVKHSAVKTLHLIQFVIMRRENSSSVQNSGIDYIFDRSPRNGESVICARSLPTSSSSRRLRLVAFFMM